MAVSSDEDPGSHIPSEPPPRTDGKVVIVKMPSFTVLDAAFMVTSMLTLVADVGTDVNLVVRYFLSGYVVWAGLTLTLVAVTAVVVAVMSMRWHLTGDSQRITKMHWIANICLWGILHRYILMFVAGIKARTTQNPDDFRDLLYQQCDASILRVFECFLEAAPQLVLQLYIMLSCNDFSVWTGITAMSSLVSLGWGLAAYAKAMRKVRPNKHKMSVMGMVLQMAWRVGTIAARVAALALATTVLQAWIVFILGLHFVVMFIWVVTQKTQFSKTKWEEHTFNFIMAITYCFCFFNLKEGQARWRMLVFYCVMMMENVGLTLTYYFLSPHKLWVKNTALAVVLACLSLGLICMVSYYRFLHPVGPIKPFGNKIGVAKEGEDSQGNIIKASKDLDSNSLDMRRDFKYLYPVGCNPSNSVLSAPGVILETSPPRSRSSSSVDTIPAIPDATITYKSPPKHPGTMCTVQDLLANVSCNSDIQIRDDEEEQTEGASGDAISSGQKRDDLEVSPTSFERSITRELNSKLSALNMKDCNPELHVTEVRKINQNTSQEEMTDLEEVEVPEVKCTRLCEPDLGDCGRNENSENSDINRKINNNIGSKDSKFNSLRHSQVKSSPNSVGLPLRLDYTSQISLDDICGSEVHHRSASILRTSSRGRRCTSDFDMRLTSLPNISSSMVNTFTNIMLAETNPECGNEPEILAPHVPNVELAVIDRMHIIETESSGVSSDGHSGYENTYEEKDIQRRNLPPKSLNLVVPNLNETQTTHSSIPHDYENICAVNINREMWGVRHWKTYSDIETRLHDDSTFKERLRILDSTIASTVYSEYNSILKGRSRRSVSLIDDCESVLSRSLPDLSAFRLDTCLEEPEEEAEKPVSFADVKTDHRLMDVLNQLRANRTINKSSSVDNIPNYETIWIGDVNKPESEETSLHTTSTGNKSSLVVTIGDVRAKESLCNLYYSTMSDLSFRYYSERMRRNYSIGSLSSHHTSHSSGREIVRAISVPDNKTLLEVRELIDEQRKREEEAAKNVENEEAAPINIESAPHQFMNTPLGVNIPPRRKFSLLRERFENPHWTPPQITTKERTDTTEKEFTAGPHS